MTELERLALLTPPADGVLDCVLDTDAYNEIDDQFAIVYALQSPERLNVQAIYAAPFWNDRSSGACDGMERSYEEIKKLLNLMEYPHDEKFVLRGSDRFLASKDEPVVSDAAKDLVERAMAATKPLYVITIGALTNIASALIMKPEIAEKIVIVWLGGTSTDWPNAREFNLCGIDMTGDLKASQIVFDCGAPFIQFPCAGVVSSFTTTPAELREFIDGKSKVGSYLTQNVVDCIPEGKPGSRVIWDVTTVAYLINEKFTPSYIRHTPILTDQGTYSFNDHRPLYRYVYHINRDKIFEDLFRKINKCV